MKGFGIILLALSLIGINAYADDQTSSASSTATNSDSSSSSSSSSDVPYPPHDPHVYTKEEMNKLKPPTPEDTRPVDPAEKRASDIAGLFSSAAKISGIVTLSDGVMYKVEIPGKGEMPSDNDTVKLNYLGFLVGNKLFANTYATGHPVATPMSSLPPGLAEVLKLVPVGSKIDVYIPAAQAYGDQGLPPKIGPGEPLHYRADFVGIVK